MPADKGTELIISQSNYDEDRAKHSEGKWASLMDKMKIRLKIKN